MFVSYLRIQLLLNDLLDAVCVHYAINYENFRSSNSKYAIIKLACVTLLHGQQSIILVLLYVLRPRLIMLRQTTTIILLW